MKQTLWKKGEENMNEFILLSDMICRKENIKKIYITKRRNYEDKKDVVYIPNKGLFKKGTFSQLETIVSNVLAPTYILKVDFGNCDLYTFAEFNNEEEAQRELQKLLLFLNKQ